MAGPSSVPIAALWPALGVIVVAVVAGGIVNCLLSGEGFYLPYLGRNKKGADRLVWVHLFLRHRA